MIRIVFLLAFLPIVANALAPVDVESFFKNVSQSPNIEPGVWSGRGDLCMQKAKETGYLMLWFLYGSNEKLPDVLRVTVKRFLENDLCRQTFCDLINDYKYIILCCENYNHSVVYNRKNAIYGYPEPKKILNEATGEYEKNHNGYPIHSTDDKTGQERWCDYPPSIHLLKIDSNVNVIFHLSSKSTTVMYDEPFSPYASKFPIPPAMCSGSAAYDRFAPWLKQYLDMYPVEEQIEEFENSGGYTKVPYTGGLVTNYTYNVVEVAVTETINPTVYQIAMHRDNVLFRAVTTVGDILVKRRIEDTLSPFDDRISARNGDGKWFINHDDTLSAYSSELVSAASMEVVPNRNCELNINQRIGNGFTFEGYSWYAVTNIYQDVLISETGAEVTMLVTNVDVRVASSPFLRKNVQRNNPVSENLIANRMYRITTGGNATFDVFSTK